MGHPTRDPERSRRSKDQDLICFPRCVGELVQSARRTPAQKHRSFAGGQAFEHAFDIVIAIRCFLMSARKLRFPPGRFMSF